MSSGLIVDDVVVEDAGEADSPLTSEPTHKVVESEDGVGMSQVASDGGTVTVASLLSDLDFLDPHMARSARSSDALRGLIGLLIETASRAGVRVVPLPGVDDKSVVVVRTLALLAQRTARQCIELDPEEALRAQAMMRRLR